MPPLKPWTLAPKKSLGIFSGIGQVMDKRQERADSLEKRLQVQEDRKAEGEMRTLEKALMEERLTDMRAPAPPTKPNRTYDAGRGAVIDLDTQTATDLGLGAKPVSPELRTVGDAVYDLSDPTKPKKIIQAPERAKDSSAQLNRELQREKMLADEYRADPHVKTAYGVAQAAAQIRAAAENVDNPQGDLDIIYSVVKIRDPNSVVREGEIDLQKAARSVGTQVAAAWQKAKAGRMLTPEEREQIVSLVGVKEDALKQQISPVQKRYGEQARRFGADSAFVAPSPFEMGEGKPAPAPKAPGGVMPSLTPAPAAKPPAKRNPWKP